MIPHQNLISIQLLLLFRNLSLAFNLEYFSQFFIKIKDQGQIWNMLVMRILKLLLIFKIDDKLTKIFKDKDKTQYLREQKKIE